MGLQPSTQFQIASISKTFTAATVLALVDDARLSLDDRLADWMNDAPESWSKITLHHLLTHTSGLPHWDGVPALDLYNGSSRADLLAQIASAPLRSEPGANWSYSSLGFILLAHVAEVASECPWASLVTERVLRPADLRHTTVAQPTHTATAAHGSTNGRPARSLELATVNIGTGDIWSTTGDLARWPRVLTATDLLSPSARQQMFAPQARITDEEGGLRDVSYGYGWFIARYGDVPLIFHPGDQAGFTSFLLWAPEAELTVAVLSADELELGSLLLPTLEQLLDL